MSNKIYYYSRRKKEVTPLASPNIISDDALNLTASIGEIEKYPAENLSLKKGQKLELKPYPDEQIRIDIDDQPYAYGKLVDMNGRMGVRLTKILRTA